MSHWVQTFTNALTWITFPALITITCAFIIPLAVRLTGVEDVEPSEPPVLRPKIPIVGHMLGLLWNHNNYFTLLSKRCTSPIYTVKMFSSRMYIVHSPELAQAAFRQSKEIDFETFKVWGCRAIEYTPHGTDIVAFRPEKGKGSYMTDLHQEMYSSLSQGPQLLETNARVLNYLAKSLNAVEIVPKSRRLFRWLRDEYTKVSADALYGSQNPVSEDPSLIQRIWDFEKDVGLLVLDVLPTMTAPKGHAGRRIVTPAFERYYNTGLDKNANGLVKGRARTARKWGLSEQEIAKAEVTIIMAAGTNTVPNVFYFLCNIYHQPELLTSRRQEVAKIITRKVQDGVDTVTLNITALQSQCPLLTACFHETLRLTKTGASVRTILEDVMLNDQYLLKKGSFLQLPTGVLQSDQKTWGPDATQFNPRRFLPQESVIKEVKKVQNQAFFPFGGGKNLCPGRHLAFTEIAAFVAMMVHGFDLSMSDGSRLEVPAGEFQRLGVASISPEKDLDVLVNRREGFESAVWRFDLESPSV